ncbi:hypothetical protein LguiB_026086 [Lonicera macranthoides]
MALSTSLSHLIQLSTITLIVLIVPTAYGQTTTTTPCTGSMLASFTPCMNLLTNSTAGGTSPTTDCCNSLKSLMKSGLDCLCLLVTASVPFQLPINRTLAASLPRACNMAGVPIQCKASVAPIPAPGPAALGPTSYPGDSPFSSPRASTVPEPLSPALAPEGDATPALTPPSGDTTPALTPPSTTAGAESPPTTSGSRTGLTPSAAGKPYLSLSPSLLLAAVGAIVFKYNY